MKYAYLYIPPENRGALIFFRRGIIDYNLKEHGGRAYRMNYGLYKDGRTPYGWDVPTFQLQSERIA